MNTENLYEGLIINNYKEVCNLLVSVKRPVTYATGSENGIIKKAIALRGQPARRYPKALGSQVDW